MALISPDWDFKQMGIGGLDKEFSDIFRRAFASRVFPPDVVEQMGMKHVRGILLYGPPGIYMYMYMYMYSFSIMVYPRNQEFIRKSNIFGVKLLLTKLDMDLI